MTRPLRLCLGIGKVPPAAAVPALRADLLSAFPRAENAAYVDALVGTDRPEQVVRERLGALALLPPLLRELDIDPTGLALARDEHDRPYLADKDGYRPVDLNLSHSDAHIACACVPAPYRVGVDVEESIPVERAQKLLSRYATAGEWRLLPADEIARAQAFTRIWTMREAMSKYQGTGQPLRFDATAPPPGSRILSFLLPDSGACLTITCSSEIITPPWVSNGSLSPIRLPDFTSQQK